MKINKNSYSQVAKWAAEYGMRAQTDCILMARYDHSTDNLENRMLLKDMEKVINDIIANNSEYQHEIQITDFSKSTASDTENEIVCGVGIMSLCMVSNGNIYPCPGWQSCVCGNVESNSLEDIWLNSDKINYLRGLRRKDLGKCAKCDKKQFCAVCMARNSNENADGNPLETNNQFCEIAEMNKNIVLKWQEKLGFKYT